MQVRKNEQPLENRYCRGRLAGRFGSRLRMECISRAAGQAVWLEHIRGHADLHDQHLYTWTRSFLRRSLAEPERAKDSYSSRRHFVWARRLSGQLHRSQAVVAVFEL